MCLEGRQAHCAPRGEAPPEFESWSELAGPGLLCKMGLAQEVSFQCQLQGRSVGSVQQGLPTASRGHFTSGDRGGGFSEKPEAEEEFLCSWGTVW